MASKSFAMLFQYWAICWVSLVFVLVPGIEVKILGGLGESAFLETGVSSCLQHVLEARKCARKIGVMAQTRTETSGQARLIRVNLPGMNVDNDGQSLFPHSIQS